MFDIVLELPLFFLFSNAGVMGCGAAEVIGLGFVCWSDGMRGCRSDWPGLCLLE